MSHALRLARRGLGSVAPNPAVGCVIVDEHGRILGRGWTQSGGRPHAETVALAGAGDGARGATAYVTLEPCAHHGKTPPCAAALIDAGIRRVVSAMEDPDPRVSGRGHAMLRKAGVEIAEGLLKQEAQAINQGFLRNLVDHRPMITLKIAQSADGRTASASGESKWITGEDARKFGHFLRARHDAVLIGVDTALADDPELTSRLPGLEARSPLRVVLDSRLRLSSHSALAKSAKSVPTLVYTVSEGGLTLRECGIEVVRVSPDPGGRPGLEFVLRDLAKRGVTRLLVEGGATVHSAFVDGGFVDRLEIFHSPVLLGGAGHASVSALAALSLSEAPHFVRIAQRKLGADILDSYTRDT